jgi:amino acid adenylation domain-containing protein
MCFTDRRQRPEVVTVSGPDAPEPLGGSSFRQLLDEITDRAPDAVAASAGARTRSYGELRARTRRLARLVAEHGVRPDDVVLLLLPPGLPMIEAMLGVWRAGAAFLPVDPAAAPAWRARTAQASGARLCLTRTDIDGIDGVSRLDLDRVDLATGDDRPLPEPGADALCHVLRTSGSSGRPKLATGQYRGLPHLVASIHDHALDLGPDAVVLQHSSPYFDLVIYEILMALGSGARLAVADRAAPLADMINELGATHTIAPAVLARLLDPADVPGLRTLVTGGDVCWVSTALAWAGSTTRLVNLYGPTEATVAATGFVVAGAELAGASTVPIGRELRGARVVVCDESLTSVPDGRRGEICIGGPIVGRGYLGQPAETARRFVPDPFGRPGELLYRTGDVGRRRPDGLVEFVGRQDFQVKIRGYRVEPGEVELALVELPSVRDAAVIADPRVPSGRLLGFVRLAPAAAPTGREIRAALAQLVPAHLVPSIVTVLDSWPLTDNGKIDRARLPLPR